MELSLNSIIWFWRLGFVWTCPPQTVDCSLYIYVSSAWQRKGMFWFLFSRSFLPSCYNYPEASLTVSLLSLVLSRNWSCTVPLRVLNCGFPTSPSRHLILFNFCPLKFLKLCPTVIVFSQHSFDLFFLFLKFALIFFSKRYSWKEKAWTVGHLNLLLFCAYWTFIFIKWHLIMLKEN